MLPIPIIAAALTGLGSVGGSILQSRLNRREAERANAYNSPINMVKRLKAAGLPTALAYSGGAGSYTSSSPTVDPTLGTAPAMAAYQQSKMMQKQVEAIDLDIDQKRSEASIKKDEAALSRDRTEYLLKRPTIVQKYGDHTTTELGHSLQVMDVQTTQGIQRARLEAQKLVNTITAESSDARIKSELAKAIEHQAKAQGKKIDNKAMKIKLNTLQRQREIIETAKKKLGEGNQAFMRWFLELSDYVITQKY